MEIQVQQVKARVFRALSMTRTHRALWADKAAHVLNDAQDGELNLAAEVDLLADIQQRHFLQEKYKFMSSGVK